MLNFNKNLFYTEGVCFLPVFLLCFLSFRRNLYCVKI